MLHMRQCRLSLDSHDGQLFPACRRPPPSALPITNRVSLQQESLFSSSWRGHKANHFGCGHPRCRTVARAMTFHGLTRRGPCKPDEDPRAAIPRAILAAAVKATCASTDFICRAARSICITNRKDSRPSHGGGIGCARSRTRGVAVLATHCANVSFLAVVQDQAVAREKGQVHRSCGCNDHAVSRVARREARQE